MANVELVSEKVVVTTLTAKNTSMVNFRRFLVVNKGSTLLLVVGRGTPSREVNNNSRTLSDRNRKPIGMNETLQ